MTPEQWQCLPVRLGAASAVLGLVLIFALNYVAGGQTFTVAQMPLLIGTGGAGVGFVALGVSIATAQRRRIERRRVEEATARLLIACAELSQAREERHGVPLDESIFARPDDMRLK